MTKVLVTGAKGMLGQDLCPALIDEGFDVIETDVNNLDITNLSKVEYFLFKEKPKYVIHCAAYTNVDKAESDLENARLINSKGTQNLAQICKKIDATMIYISTDFVFDGKSNVLYTPQDKPNPINNYGLTKLEGESAIRENLDKYYICRTSWLYGHHGDNFVEKMLSLSNEPELKVVDDQIGSPTWTVELTDVIISILDEEPPYGIYHICGTGAVSRYEFAKEIFRLAKLKVNLKPCKTADIPHLAQRPKYSAMDNDNLCRNWKLALRDYIELRIEDID